MNDDFREFIDELLAKTDIVSVISRYVPLKQKGNTHWGCCPFHHEKDPSFAVNQGKQFYHCFGCKESGNAITFVEKMESVDFMDAVRILAENAHIEVPQFKSGGRSGGYDREKKKRLASLMRDAARHYHENLSSPQASTACAYLVRRGIEKPLVTKFGLGYSINGTEIIDFLLSKGYTKPEMKEAGLIEQRADSYYDVFYGRLLFPIIDNFGDVVAFGGRTLKENYEFAKYRNSSQTPIFDKSRNIYGINLLKKKKQRENVDFVIMTEGYMDVIALHKGGFDTAVASMGTALTAQQAKLIKNYAQKVYISYDGDSAGQKATMRGLDILADCGLSVRVVSLPDGMDPDDVIKKLGSTTYKKLLDEAKTLTAFKIETLKKAYDLTDPEEKSKFTVEAVKVITALPNPVQQEEYINLVQSYTGYSKQVLMKQAELSFSESDAPATATPVGKTRESSSDRRAALFMLAAIASEKDYAAVGFDENILPDETYREVYGALCESLKGGGVRMDSMFYALTDGGKALLAEIADYEFMDGDGAEKYRDCLRRLEIKKAEDELAAMNDALKGADKEEQLTLLKKIGSLTRKLSEIKTNR
ncbi:MAG: DNA primase [Clostridia bacterium]|nr:DNA primase [Clostridia bacterium]